MSAVHIKRDVNKNYIYRQIYRQIKKDILLNNYLPDEKLPSKREMSERLNVSLNSVNNAYQQLLAEGYIYSVPRSGFYVEKLDMIPLSSSTDRPLSPDLEEARESKEDWISFSHMSADHSVFPLDKWLSCESKALKTHRTKLNDDSTRYPQGIYSVRKAIVRLISVTRGIRCHPEQIVLGSGTQMLLSILRHILPHHFKYAMEDPGYWRVNRLLKLLHADIQAVPLDRKGISIDAIRQLNPNVVYVTPSHQFPTGILMPVSRRIQLLNWASKTDRRYIIEDDYDSEFKYKSDTVPSLQGMDSFDKVIYIGTFSKSLLPGLRLSYMILPQNLLRTYRQSADFLMQTCNVMAQLTLQQFIDSGEYQKHIKHMRKVYSERRVKLIGALKKRFGSSISIRGAKAGLHFIVLFHSKTPVEQIIRRAKIEKIELYHLNNYDLNKDNRLTEPAFILGFANLPIDRIEEGVDRLYRAVFEREK